MSSQVQDGDNSNKVASEPRQKQQRVYLIRHGDRWDYENKQEWQSTRSGDPPLSRLGHLQARETGQFLAQHLLQQVPGLQLEQVTFLASPFLRTIQTMNELIDQFESVPSNTLTNLSQVKIRPEYSVFEWDGHNGKWHASLPSSMEERFHYFPRIDLHHTSLFVPTLPEPKSHFHHRCQRVLESLAHRYHNVEQYPVIVIVTHAAGCIGLCAAATQASKPSDNDNNLYAHIEPASPCSIYELTRDAASTNRLTADPDGDTQAKVMWSLPPPGQPLNGHVDHLSALGSATTPWNHFGDKSLPNRGYTGPLNSKLAPKTV